MKKNVIISCLSIAIFAITHCLCAQDAQELMKGVSAKHKAYSTIKASFTYTMETKGKPVQTQTGMIYLKGDKYKLEIAGQEMFCDGKTLWTYLKESNEVQVNVPTANKDDISPTNIFTMYDKGFLYKMASDKVDADKQMVELTPIDKSKSFFKIKLTINKADKQIVDSQVFDKSGGKNTYVIKSFVGNTPIPDDFFTFNKAKYPGIEVVDLR